MNYYESKQRKTDGKWDYTRNKRPTGYCCAYREIPKDADTLICEEHHDTSHKHHVDGHNTEEEAIACYKEYLLDHELRLDREMSNNQQKCRVCGDWTQKYADIGLTQMFILCDEHNNREEVEKLYQAPSLSMSSW